jgi:hypothetical protein
LPVFVASKGGRWKLSFCRSASAITATKLGGKALNLQNFLKKLNLYFFSEAVLLNWQPTVEAKSWRAFRSTSLSTYEKVH